MRVLAVIDGTYELFRAHFSKRPPHSAPGGQDVKATVGLMFSCLSLLEDPTQRPTHVAAAFDFPIRSFRNDLFADYKTEAGVPAELLAQFALALEATRALGIVTWPMVEFEADDALATAAQRYSPEVDQVQLLTPDKDVGQCLRGASVVQVDRMRQVTKTEATLKAATGLLPESIPDYLALVGDTADGIPGLPGFGEKTAQALLSRYVHIEDIPSDPRAWDVTVRGADRLAKTLIDHRDDARLFRRLATLVQDVPLTETIDDLEWRGVPRSRFLAFCERLGTRNLIERPTRWLD